MKDGLRHNKYGDIQKLNCKDCGFTINLGFERMHATPELVTSAMQLYFTGESLRNIQKFLKMQGVKITHVSVYNWIRKYAGLMKAYLEKITPNVADAWRADELYLKSDSASVSSELGIEEYVAKIIIGAAKKATK